MKWIALRGRDAQNILRDWQRQRGEWEGNSSRSALRSQWISCVNSQMGFNRNTLWPGELFSHAGGCCYSSHTYSYVLHAWVAITILKWQEVAATMWSSNFKLQENLLVSASSRCGGCGMWPMFGCKKTSW